MSTATQIFNWISIGIDNTSIGESFYYDRRDNAFFSIMFLDYFMLDEDMNVASDITTSYSKAQENSLIDRMKRIELKDKDIILIPNVPLEERKSFMNQFVNTLTNKELIEILNQRIKNHDHGTKFDFYFGDEADEFTKQKWGEEKSIFLRQKAEQFLQFHHINIDTASIWDVGADGSISFDLTKD